MALRLQDHWYSLNGRLKLCGFVAVLGIAGVTIFSFAASWRSAYRDAYDFFRQAEAEMDSRLNTALDEIQTIARNVGYSIPVQRFLLSNNPEIVIMNYNTASEYITAALNASEYCRNVYITGAGGRYLRAARYRINEIREGIAAHTLGGGGGVELSRPVFETRQNDEGRNELYFYFPIYNILWVEQANTLICAAICDMNDITSIPSFGEDYFTGGTVLLLYKNRIISSSREVSAEEQKALSAAAPGQSRMRIGGKNYLTIKVSLPETMGRNSPNGSELFWDCIYFIPEKEIIFRTFSHINRGLIILSAVMVFIAAVLLVLIHSMNEAISRLLEDISILDYDRPFSLHKPRFKELALIAHSTNLMLDRINRAVQVEQDTNAKLLSAVTAQAQAEFMGYRTQISPHFLFNTLECMRAMARSGGNVHLETMISSMSWMFRYSIYTKPMVSLSLELEHLSNYMRVMNIRTEGLYRLKTRINAEAADRLIPSMILQPLAENSISHGFNHSTHSNCIIFLEALCGGGDREPLRFRFVDNGIGIEEETLGAILSDLGKEGETVHALQNIYRRMRLCFGDGFNFTIRSRQGYYTVIEMVIPAETELGIPEIK